MGESLSEHAARAGERALEMAGAAPYPRHLLAAVTNRQWRKAATLNAVCLQANLRQK